MLRFRAIGTVLPAAVLCVLSALPLACGGDKGATPQPSQQSSSKAAAAAPTYDAATIAAMNHAYGLMGKFEFEAAAAEFDAIARKAGAPPEATLDRAIATMNQSRDGAQEQAIAMLREFVKANASKDQPAKDLVLRARYAIALCDLYLGRAAEAAPAFVEIAQARGADAYAQYFAGQSLEQVGEHAKALGWYERAAERDGYLKSAELGIQRCARKTGDDARAERALAAFEKLSANPRARAAEFKYTRMGDMGLAVVVDDAARAPYTPPTGPIFEAPQEMAIDIPADFAIQWSTEVEQHAATVDLNGDGRLDIVVTRGILLPNESGAVEPRTLVLLARDGGRFVLAPDHPLSRLAGSRVNSILFGDIDGDGLADAYVCRVGGNALLLQTADHGFRDATKESKAGGNGGICVDGALADLDHDGDLDIFVLFRDVPNDLLANNGDGTFRSIGAQAGVATDERGPRSVIIGDFDYDRDADILVLNDTLPHELFLNDRLWKWTPGTTPGISTTQLNDSAASAAIVEMADLPLRRAVFATSSYLRLPRRVDQITQNRSIELGVADVTGDGHLDLMEFGFDRIVMRDETCKNVQECTVPADSVRTQLVMLDPVHGSHLITLRVGKPPLLWAPGSGRGPFTAIAFSGRVDPSQSMRSNTSGIGTGYAARIGGEWMGGEGFRPSTGRSQSLAPVAIGTGPIGKIDALEIEWSDGVFQSEVDLAGGTTHAITETQRQISSCPVLSAWNGREMRFVTDLLGVGGVGFLLEPGVYSESRPIESLVLPEGALAPKADGTLSLALAEPMEESCMLDSVRLRAIDLPAGWDIAPDERMAIGGAAPMSEIIAWKTAWLPSGNPALAKADLVASEVGKVDPRFIGRLAQEQVIELDFGTAIDAIAEPWLVIDGWIEYPYCQTMFAAWQAGAKYKAPGLEARAADGTWKELVAEWGYPAGMPRRMALPIPKSALPTGTTALRMRTNMEIYFDSVRLVAREPLPVQPVELALSRASLASPGFAKRTTGPQKQPFYDNANRLPLWDCRFQRGLYTEFGDVRELLAAHDSATVVFGPGEEVSVDFAAPAQAAPAGSTRRFVLETRGWCKDMDLYTRDGETVEPMPADATLTPSSRAMQAKSRTRAMGGR